jgi:hypothetical protein
MEGDVLTDKPTIIEAIRNPDLFDSLFKTQSTWVASIVWLKAVLGWTWPLASNRQNSSW